VSAREMGAPAAASASAPFATPTPASASRIRERSFGWRRVGALAAVLALAYLAFGVALARADDSVGFGLPASQPVAGRVTQVPIGVIVDSSFDGGTVDVVVATSGDCGQTPDETNGSPASFLHGNTVKAGPLTLSPGQSGIVALVSLAAGRNLICVWLSDSAGIVLAGNAVFMVALPNPVLRRWNPQTAACGVLTRTEAAQALQLPGSVLHQYCEPWPAGLTDFEKSHGSFSYWQDNKNSWSVGVIVWPWPEQTPPTLAYDLKLYYDTGSFSKFSGPCMPVSHVGTAACLFRGFNSQGGILAVDRNRVIQITIEGSASLSAARIRGEEPALARAVLSRLAR
jgi:hypothetical protein